MIIKPLFLKGGVYLRGALVILGAFLFSSCSIQKDRVSHSKPLDLTSSIEQAFLSRDFVPGEWSSEKWWEMFNDLQLNSFIERTLEVNPNLQAAFETVLLAHEVAKQNFSPLLPSVSAQFNEDLFAFKWKREGLKLDPALVPRNIFPNWINYLGTMLSFKWALDIWGKQDKLYKAALDEAKAQLAQTAYTKLLLSIQVATSYFRMQQSLKELTLQKAKLEIYQNILSIQKELQKFALAYETDLISIEKTILQIDENLLSVTEIIEKCQHQLRIFMGLSPCDPAPWDTPSVQDEWAFPFPEEISSDLLAKRPDIVSKIWSIQAAMKRVNSAKVAFLPSINLASFSGYFTFTYKELMKPRAWFTSILPGATLPIFEGLSLRANLKYRLREYNLAVYEYNGLLLTAAQDIVDSITSFRIVNQQISLQEEILQRTQENLDLTRMRYQYGLDTSLDVLMGEAEAIADQLQYQQYAQTRLLCILNLIKSIGGGYSCPEAQVDMEKDFIYE
jgi:NodT family efflux transporter outer membrane factor (OMF) lipoprotein